MKKIIFFSVVCGIFFLNIFLSAGPVRAEENQEFNVSPVRIYLFHSETCPHCKKELAFLETIKKKYPQLEVKDFEVSSDIKNQSLFIGIQKQYDLDGSVPVTIIGDEVTVGFNEDIGEEIEEKIKACSEKACDSSLDGRLSLERPSQSQPICLEEKIYKVQGIAPKACPEDAEKEKEAKTPSANVLGRKIELGEKSIWALGAGLGLADGINPCMFSVLVFLLSYILSVGSRGRALKAGLAFIITTFFVYFLFMIGIFKVIDILRISQYVRWIIGSAALIFGAIMIKDFFFYGRWISLEISDRFKPMIERLTRNGTVPGAVLLAIFSSIVELPCTSGIPLAFVSVISEKGIGPVAPLLLYNLFFVLPLAVIVFSVVFAWAKVEKIEEKRSALRKWMRLAAGVILLLMGLALLLKWL